MKYFFKFLTHVFDFFTNCVTLLLVIILCFLMINSNHAKQAVNNYNYETQANAIKQEQKQPKEIIYADQAQSINHSSSVDAANPQEEYKDAVRNGLPRGTSMTVPDKSGVYNIYIKNARHDIKFNTGVKEAVKVWRNKTDIPMKITTHYKKAQIIIKLIKGYIYKPNRDGSVTTGITTLYQNALNHKTNITISQLACNSTDAEYSDTVEHELGHAMGLEHTSRKNDVMDPVSNNLSHNKLTRPDIKDAKRNYKAVKQL